MSFSSMYVGTTGMKSHGERMGNIGNNLANVNTLAYKSADVHFQTLMSQFASTGSSPDVSMSQKGLGVGLGGILTDFNIGGFQPGAEATDLAIAGDGFFRVTQDDKVRYTRAGNFRFDKEGFLVDPNGYHVQGKTIDDNGNVAAATTDIQLTMGEGGLVTVPPKATSAVSLNVNLGLAADEERTSDATDPFFALLKSWDGTNEDGPLDTEATAYSAAVKVYDDQGNAHTLNVHFDPVSASNAGGETTYEFVAGFDPGEDGRAAMAGTKGAGLAMAGTLTFDSSGQLKGMSAFNYSGTGDANDPANWTPAGVSEDGAPTFDMTFLSADETGATVTSGPSTISLDLGLTGTGFDSGTIASAADIGTDASLLPTMTGATPASRPTTNFMGTSSTITKAQDGYAEGFLSSISVDRSGVMVGNFSNGVNKDLFQFSLFTFTNEWGLRREGANHFSATQDSGEAVEGTPGEANFGVLSERTLETSNVDMADQFVKMISTERGFQANSKVITTSDSILEMLINMKR